MSLSLLPNLLCVLRMVLAVPLVWTLIEGHFAWTLLIFLVAAATDGLDGFLAKRLHCETELGKLLDPIADKLLLVSAFVALTIIGLVPLWLTATAVARDLIIGGGAAVYRRLFGPLQGRPTWPSKINTVFQLSYGLAVVAAAAAPALVPQAIVIALGATTFVTTVVSGADYVSLYARKAAAVSRSRATGAELPK
ncbi:MAG: CDP-alcohol phosphatidyltransferase family protein [Steroidobacteraceae bacterium]|nr:CDP-alcohol phosphatidyltransferase family protein [Steroidobacteraceae bacterium]